MFKGFYTAASGMLTQTRVLNTVSNNMTNASAPGYKSDLLTTTTFEDMLIARTGNQEKSYDPIGTASTIRIADELVTNYNEGAWEMTDRPLDFAVQGEGFFEVQMPDGEIRYTRNGSFNLDDERYLTFQHVGRVLDPNGQPIQLPTDNISVTQEGTITDMETGELLGTIGVVNFLDYSVLEKNGEGMFLNPDAANEMPVEQMEHTLRQGTLERSNVSALDEMLIMINSQKALQSAGQVLKGYDTMMDKVTIIGTLK